MGLWNWIEKQLYGVDIAQTQADSNRSDLQLAELNRQALADGTYSQSIYDQAESQRQASVLDAQGQVNEAFGQGWDEGAANVRNTIGGIVEAPFKLAGKIIPWQIWLLGAVVLFLYLGGGAWLVRKAKGKLAT